MAEFIFELQRFDDITNTVTSKNVWGTSSRDNIYNYARFSNVWAGRGNDRIVNLNNDYSKIYAEDGDDTVSSNGRVTIYGGNGDDVIYLDNDYSYIDGGDDDDHIYIQNYGSKNTITGGKGNNSIIGNGKAQVYICVEGDDTIDNYGADSTIKIASEDYSSMTNGNDLVIKIDNASITLKDGAGKNINIQSGSSGMIQNPDEDNNVTNTADETTLEAGKGNDTLLNTGNKVLLSGGDDNDYLGNSGGNATLHGDNGNDTIFNHGGNSTIGGYAGNDYINNSGASVTVNGGAGNDYIYNSGSTVTIAGGKENDFIKNSGANVLFEYTQGDGYDVIEGFNSTSTLKISNFLASDRYSRTTLGNDILVNVDSDGVILKGAATLATVHIVGTEIAPETVRTPSETYSFTEGDDNVLSYTYSDFYAASSVIYLLGGNDSMRNATGNFNSISGGAGSDTVNNSGTFVSVSGGNDNDSIRSNGSNSTLNGDAGDDSISNGGEKTKVFGDAGNDSISNTGDKVTLDGGAGNDFITNSWQHSALMYGGDGNDVISMGGEYTGTFWYKGNTVAGGKGNDTIYNNGQEQIYKYFAGDGNDVIVGFHEKDTLCIADARYTSATSGNDIVIKIGTGSVTLKDASGKTLNINGVPDFVEPVEIKISQGTDTTPANENPFDASASKKAVKLIGNKSDNTILGGSGADTLDGAAGKDSLVGNAGNDSLNGGAGNDKLNGGSGKDTLHGGKGNDTLTGGKGNDLFIFSAGKDVITDYATGDKISIGAAIAKTSLKGSDAIFTIGKNTLTVKQGKGKELTFINASGKTQKIIGGAFLASNSTSSKVTLESWRTIADASSRTKAIQITGNALANKIYGGSKNDTLYGGKGNDYLIGNAGNDKLYGDAGNDSLAGGKGNDTLTGGAGNDSILGDAGKDYLSGGAGKDTLWGGAGNDTLYGGAGNDTFIYKPDEGKDYIMDYKSGDMLQIMGGKFSGSKYSKGTLALTVGSGSVTFKNVTTSTTFNINDTLYKVSGSKIIKK